MWREECKTVGGPVLFLAGDKLSWEYEAKWKP